MIRCNTLHAFGKAALYKHPVCTAQKCCCPPALGSHTFVQQSLSVLKMPRAKCTCGLWHKIVHFAFFSLHNFVLWSSLRLCCSSHKLDLRSPDLYFIIRFHWWKSITCLGLLSPNEMNATWTICHTHSASARLRQGWHKRDLVQELTFYCMHYLCIHFHT